MERTSRRRLVSQFWKTLPRSAHALFLLGVFFTFLPVALLQDVADLGTHPPGRLAIELAFSGGIAVAWAAAMVKPRVFTPIVAAIQILFTIQFYRHAPHFTAVPVTELRPRLATEAGAALLSIIAGYIVFTRFIVRQGVRYVREHTEIALAGDIHRLLVPSIDRRIGRFEFCGVSVPSGEVGGDLVDLVDVDDRWIAYIADVSGHGVAAGLLMAMVKSAARMKLRGGQSIGALLDELNVVLLDLKKPEMFVTFAGVQYDGSPKLTFCLAGHPPILHYQSATSGIEELSLAHVPLAMFEERRFSAAQVAFAPADVFLIVTDGLTEVFDGADREFGLDVLKAIVRQRAAGPLRELKDSLLDAVRRHGAQLDDQTLLLIRVVA